MRNLAEPNPTIQGRQMEQLQERKRSVPFNETEQNIDPPNEEYMQIVTQKYVRTMQKALTKKRIRRARKNFCHFIRSFDQFGQPIPLNYKGSDTYKTLPGSFLSMIAIVLLAVGLMKGVNNLIYNREWQENTQVEILGRDELTKEVQFRDFPRLKAGIELKLPEGSDVETREEYLNYAELIAEVYSVMEVSYIKNASGFFQVKDKPENNIMYYDDEEMEADGFGFKHARKDPTEMVNSQDYLEFSIDLNGTSISGSESTTMAVRNKYVSFLHMLDNNALFRKMISECRANATCGAILPSDATVYNTLAEVYQCDDSKNTSQKEGYFKYLREALQNEDQKYIQHYSYLMQFETVDFTTPHGLSKCDELNFQRMAGNGECDYDDHDIELGSKCLFKWHSTNLTERLNDAHSNIQFQPVIYDEITYFKDGQNKYPFQQRKSKFNPPQTKGYPKDTDLKVEQYVVTLQKHQVCMDDNIWAEFMMFQDEIYNKCNYEHDFEILQRTEFTVAYKTMPMEVTLMLTLTLDNQMEKTTVRSYKFYDMLSDNGGFFEALISLFAFFGSPISRIFFQYSIAKDSYYTRDKKKVLQEKFKTADGLRGQIFRSGDRFDYQKIKEFFPKIRFTAGFYALSACCKCLICKCCKGLKQQKRILKKANDRFEDELDVIQLLKKVRLSTDIWTQLLSRSQKKALKYSRSNVVVQKDKKKNPLLRRIKTLFEKLEHPSTTSDSISFSISNTSSESSFFREENKALLHPKVLESQDFFQVPVVNTLPFPKKMPNGLRFPQFIQEEFFSDPSPSPLGLQLREYSSGFQSDKPYLRKRAASSSSHETQRSNLPTGANKDFTTLAPVKLASNRHRRRSKKKLIDDSPAQRDSEMPSDDDLHSGSHSRRQKPRPKDHDQMASVGFDSPNPDHNESRNRVADESIAIPSSNSRFLPQMGDSSTPLTSEQRRGTLNSDTGVRRKKKRKKKPTSEVELGQMTGALPKLPGVISKE